MTTYHLHHAQAPQEKDLHEIVVMVGVLTLVLGAITGYMLLQITGAVIGGIAGCALGGLIVYRLVMHGIDNGAKEIKFRKS
jgi:hypothetical protein